MSESLDSELLAAFVGRRDEEAFAALVRRHLAMIYSAALRQVHDVHFAEEAAQAVFVVLAHKAASVRPASALPGWLLGTTRNVCRDLLKREQRRLIHERKAAAMKPDAQLDDSERQWGEMAPHLDELLARLKEPDRSAVVMRFLEGRSLGEVAAALGVSNDAASKRIARALAKLRERFAAKGLMLSVAAMSAALAHATSTPPTTLLQAATAAGLSTVKGTAAGSAALLGKGAMTTMAAKTMWSGIAAMLLILIGGVTAIHLATRPSASTPAISTANPSNSMQRKSGSAPTTVPTDSKPIKVGVIVSLFTATGPHWLPNPHGYAGAQFILRELRDPSIECIPLIEPGSENDEALQAFLTTDFAGKKPVIAVDAAHLAELDVIVAARVANATDELLTAVEGRVKAGAGLLIRQSFGVITPGYTPQVTALNGFVEAQYALTQGASGKVVAEHPLLGNLKTGRMLRLVPNGAYGKLAAGAVGLIEIAGGNINPLGDNAQPRDDFAFYPLYVSQLGKGRIVGCSISGTQPEPAQLNAAVGGKFTIRCVKWLAGRPLI